MTKSEPFQRAYAAALASLSRRPRTEAELRKRLARGHSAAVVDEVVAVLRNESRLDDAAFARLWRDSRLSLNPRSGAAIRRELVAKGVERDLATEATQSVDDEDSAYRAGQKLARRLRDVDSRTFQRKLGGYLQRRGFGASVGRMVVARLWQEREQAAEGASPPEVA